MHVARLATDESFVGFDFAAQLAAVLALQGQAEARQHEPRGLLSHAERTGQFVRTNAVLAVGEQPEGRKPLLETERGILEDGSNLEGELSAGMLRVALVPALSLKVGNFVGTAGRAHNRTVRPSDRFDGLAAVGVIREEQDCFAEGLGFVRGRHNEGIMAGT